MKKSILIKSFAILVSFALVTVSCNDDDDDNGGRASGWSDVMRGNDIEEITWPDQSENYWEYTMDVSKYANTGLRFKGCFPVDDTRFFNITLYDDNSTQRITSIEDFNIEPEPGSANPFELTGVRGNNYFVINAVPSGTPESVKSSLSNVIEFPAETKKLSMLLRIYFNSTNHPGTFGGVDLPKISFFNTQTGEERGKAVRASSNYFEKCQSIVNSIPVLQSIPALVFTLAPNLMYSNGPTGYVTATNRLKTGQMLTFGFKPPVHPKSVSNYHTADVRYWSICVGDTVTHTPVTIPDREVVMSADGYAYFIVVSAQDQYLKHIKTKAAAMNINVITWDVAGRGEPLMIFYRQMYIRSGYEHSVQLIPSYPPLDAQGYPDKSVPIVPANMAHNTLGEYGPSGLKFDESRGGSGFFLSDYFSYYYMRISAGN